MTPVRVLWPIVVAATLAACSGNLGSGQSSLPGMPQNGTNVQQINPPPPTSTPVSASNVATLGDSAVPQALPAFNGWSGSIAFAKPTAAPSASPNPKASAAPVDPLAGAVSIGVTTSVVEPTDAPRLGTASTKRRAKRDPNAIAALFFISLLATSDVTLAAYPQIAVDVPREIAAAHRDDTFALALYDPAEKAKAFRLAVAERDLSSSPAPGSIASPTPVPTAAAIATPFGTFNGPGAFTPPPAGSDLSSLPPEHVAFKATASTLTLKANRSVVFALYAIPPQPSPSPSPSVSAAPSPRAAGSPAAPAPSSTASTSAASPPAASPSPGPASSMSPSGSPTASPKPVTER